MGESRVACMFLVGKPEGRRHLKDPRVQGRIMLKWILEKWDSGMDGIDLAQDTDSWRALVNAIMNLHVP